jgi:MOSC domain-containing protein YiiM
MDSMPAKLEEIYVVGTKAMPLQAVDQAVVVEGAGIEGDRYAARQGTFTKEQEEGDSGRHVTLIEAEAIEAALGEFGDDFREGRSRRNLVTRGIPLNDLVNHRLQIGEVILRGDRSCPPCEHLSRLTATDSRKSLNNRGGLRTTVIKGGVIRVGDQIKVLEGLRDR